MDVVANAGTISSGIISAVDVELGSKPERCLNGYLNQMCCVLRRLAGAALGISSGNIEVAQNDVMEIMSRAGVTQHDFRHQLRPAIRRYWRRARILGDRHLRRI